MKVSGKFDVKLQPLEAHAQGVDGVNLGRISLRIEDRQHFYDFDYELAVPSLN